MSEEESGLLSRSEGGAEDDKTFNRDNNNLKLTQEITDMHPGSRKTLAASSFHPFNLACECRIAQGRIW